MSLRSVWQYFERVPDCDAQIIRLSSVVVSARPRRCWLSQRNDAFSPFLDVGLSFGNGWKGADAAGNPCGLERPH
jgi:hypothetical protein